MAHQEESPFGSWKSPITSDHIISGSIGIGDLSTDGGNIYWTEMRASEGGRSVIVRRTPDGTIKDMTSPPYDVRTKVHEYGGGSFSVRDDLLCFSNFADQRLYRQIDTKHPEPLTPPGVDLRYADGFIDPKIGRIICVREDHTDKYTVTNTLVWIDLRRGGPGNILASGHDFYSSPVLSPDGSHLAWISWDHPNMPWDSTQLWVAEISQDGLLTNPFLVAGKTNASVCHPQWSPAGILHFVSDFNGWWNIYRWRNGKCEVLASKKAEFTQAQWTLGTRFYDFVDETRIICAYTQKGVWTLANLLIDQHRLEDISSPLTDISHAGLKLVGETAVLVAGSPTLPYTVVLQNPGSEPSMLRPTTQENIPASCMSEPEAIEFPTENGLTAHGFYYRPKNGDFVAPPGEKPPLLVIIHGGPTGSATTTLDMRTQYWTSRGIGVLDVNYSGSTGYGTDYRRRLNGRWGVIDLDDCINGAKYLVKRGDVDESRLAIRGRSAGGYTALAALTFRDVFRAGASYYGISDLESLTKETHKFESRYLDSMIGPYPERRDLYLERSPIHHIGGLEVPVILFQGLKDNVVPSSQAEKVVSALRNRRIPVAYLPFKDEEHGFRKPNNIKRSIEAELYFYSNVFRFALAEPVESIIIENLQQDDITGQQI